MSFRGEAATEECEWKLLRECVKCQWILERKKPLWNIPWNELFFQFRNAKTQLIYLAKPLKNTWKGVHFFKLQAWTLLIIQLYFRHFSSIFPTFQNSFFNVTLWNDWFHERLERFCLFVQYICVSWKERNLNQLFQTF